MGLDEIRAVGADRGYGSSTLASSLLARIGKYCTLKQSMLKTADKLSW